MVAVGAGTSFSDNVGVGVGANAAVYSVVGTPDGGYLLGGGFTEFAGVPANNRVVKLHADGTLDEGFAVNTGSGTNGQVNAVKNTADGGYVIGGNFSRFADSVAGRVVKFEVASVSGAPVAGVVDSAYTFTFDVGGYPAPTVAVTAGVLPAGLTLSAEGVLSGTPEVEGDFDFTVTATNGVGAAATYPTRITIAPKAAPTSTPAGPDRVTDEDRVDVGAEGPQSAFPGALPVVSCTFWGCDVSRWA